MRGTSLALLSCAFFGLGYVLKKILLVSLSPLLITAILSVFSALFLLAFMDVKHKIREIFTLRKREVLALAVVGLVSGFLAEFLFLLGLDSTSVSNAVLLSRTNSLFMAFFATIVFREKIRFSQILGGIMMILGLYVIATQGMKVGLSYMTGDLFLITAGFLLAFGNTIMKKYLDHVPPEVIVLWKSAIGGVVLLSLCFTGGAFSGFSTSGIILGDFLILVISNVIAYVLWYKALELTTESNVGLTALSVPFFTIIIAMGILSETMESYQVVGGGLILLGLIVLEVHLSKAKSLRNYARILRLLHT